MAKCCDNPAAKHNRRVTIQNLSLAPDGQGGFTESWTNSSTVWCSIEPYKGWERFQAGQLATPITHKIEMRYNRSLSTTSRLKFGTRYFEVKEALNRNEENRFLDIRAVEIEGAEEVGETFHILLEDGFSLLLEDGSNLLLEAA